MHIKLSTREGQTGSSLLIVLIIGLVVIGTVAVATQLAMVTSRAEAEASSVALESYSVEAASDLLRTDLVDDLTASGMSVAAWLQDIRVGNRFPVGVKRQYPNMPLAETWIDAVAPQGGGTWVEIVAATNVSGNAQSLQQIRRRIKFGSSGVMDFAMLARTTNCMFCHMEIQGDVGSLDQFKPGWGADNSGSSSSILGSVYAAQDVYDGTGAHAGTANGTSVNGSIYEYYNGPKLPLDSDGDGSPDFPTFSPAVARSKAAGSVWVPPASGSGVWVTPLLGDWNPGAATTVSTPPAGSTGDTWKPSTAATLGSVIEGNVTLIGTAANPIQIDGDVFVSGDVVIKGHVSGQGAIYAGRNVFVAGDIVYDNPPDAMNGDSDAIAAIADGKDELRLAARSNVILGDWTYQESNGDARPMMDRQGQAFIASSLGLWAPRYYKKSDGVDSSTEVSLVNGQYIDDQGDTVDANDVAYVVDWNNTVGWDSGGTDVRVRPEHYDPVAGMTQITSDGSLHSWMQQDEYRDILGYETYTDMTWRMPAPPDSSTAENELGAAWGDYAVNDMSNGDRAYYGDDEGNGRLLYKNGSYRMVEGGERDHTTLVSRVDAFLYANRRVAGSMPPVVGVTINGGVVGQEIQILAPGRGNSISWWTNWVNLGDTDNFDQFKWDWHPDENQSQTSPHGDTQDALHLNYDYRLRNGGLGYGLVGQGAGDQLFFVKEDHAHSGN